ncbi:MAG: MarR family transcriptional regulator [Terracidiphilus sp.]|jgi:DNA-binding MarR family transcriptional regulator
MELRLNSLASVSQLKYTVDRERLKHVLLLMGSARKICLTDQTNRGMLPRMLENNVRRLLGAYPTIYLACHREHTRADQAGKPLTENQASVLDHLDAAHPTTLSKLAEHMGVGRSTMSITVARLVRGGYIARRPGKQDRRTTGLTLTPAGKRIKEQSSVLNPQLIRQMLKMMEPAEAERALAGMECLAKYAAILLKQRKRARDK